MNQIILIGLGSLTAALEPSSAKLCPSPVFSPDTGNGYGRREGISDLQANGTLPAMRNGLDHWTRPRLADRAAAGARKLGTTQGLGSWHNRDN